MKVIPGQLLTIFLAACSAEGSSNRQQTDDVFPSVIGATEDGRSWRVPDDFAGAPLLVVAVGDPVEAAADVERWYRGLAEVGVPVSTVELRMSRDRGPWTSEPDPAASPPGGSIGRTAIYVGDDADVLVRFMRGAWRRDRACVSLLDESGRIVFCEPAGYSEARCVYLADVVDWLRRRRRFADARQR